MFVPFLSDVASFRVDALGVGLVEPHFIPASEICEIDCSDPIDCAELLITWPATSGKTLRLC